MMYQNNALTDEYSRLRTLNKTFIDQKADLEKKIKEILNKMKLKANLDPRLIYSLKKSILAPVEIVSFPRSQSGGKILKGQRVNTRSKYRSSSLIKKPPVFTQKREYIDVLLNKWTNPLSKESNLWKSQTVTGFNLETTKHHKMKESSFSKSDLKNLKSLPGLEKVHPKIHHFPTVY